MFDEISSIFLDFDGTITKQDTVNSFFKIFAKPEWINVEQEWINGKISSCTCMQLQLDLIDNLTEEKFYNFLNSIQIQDGFIKFCTLAEQNNKNIAVISDGFDYFIEYILKKENINTPFFANKLDFLKENGFLKFKLSFPNTDNACPLSLGSCKCAKVKNLTAEDEKFLFAGDGLSDRCIASKAHLLFAKNSLKNHCVKNGMNFSEFNDFNDILNRLSLKKGMKNAGFKTENTIGS